MRISDWSSDVCSSDLCAPGSQALAAARTKILSGDCEVALVVGADTTPKGFLAPAKGERPDDPDWVRFRIGITNPTYFALYARRRLEIGRASCRERVCKYGYISLVAVSLKKKIH